MYEAMMIASTGLHNQQRRLDTIAHNIANVNTVGFKNSRLDFKDALYTAGIVPALPRTPEPEGNQQKGHGVMVAGITKDFTQGSYQSTERHLDVAINGEGFFAVENIDGETVYTRNGSFNLSVEDDGVYIVNGSGYYVLDTDGARIRIPDRTESISIAHDGSIAFTVDEDTTYVNLGVFTFRNLMGLSSIGDSNYAETEASGERMAAEGAVVVQGGLEISNVKLSEEMTRIIRTQRVFQLASRALTTADEMEGIANNMRR